ncbi:Mannosyl-glycoprotein endo-beta-N-acetylglucosamidase [Stappia aggregata IAM 12614]|uniref:Mannosyl-glycoprotein endo-beta-N-acetylglucosamidase n=1 Tax=Roseibium aggregatum (strain ATCC 25650 / DSM 13394 / JCM 20685 / NBRC 16684 / NCIMB 2208 / IAM 12614 / B1) TaxID=384765 RepID=A0NVU2_ROSAI|nr:glucosaminidase domain-containing protein [Roseibium aggregatum]EAV43107.1 Mannosyl-glycoprotein endo-beta-N-acetylglucosamidase [Stappia aggregata IAM 12614] [Roseibium aggregatum IAM 12614]
MKNLVNEFTRNVYIAAKNLGLPDPQARLAATQASLETAYGKSVKGNNYFGIKAGASWKGKKQDFRTWEDEGGKKIVLTDSFRRYGSLQESLQDWVETVSSRWPDAMSARTFEDAVKGLHAGVPGKGYATDKLYGQKLSYIERKIGETYAPPSEGLQRFFRETEKDIDLHNILMGHRNAPRSPNIFDTHEMAGLNAAAIPVPGRKPTSEMEVHRESALNVPLDRTAGPSPAVPRRKPGADLAATGAGNEEDFNPFDLKNPNLKLQALLLEKSPALAERLIVSAGRDPRLFGL